MPNTGQLEGQTFKCEKCRKEFKQVWLSCKVCCKIAAAEGGPGLQTSSYYSRHLSKDSTDGTLVRSATSVPKSEGSKPLSVKLPGHKTEVQVQYLSNPTMRYVNSLAPFSTLGKSTCGYYFSRGTDNKKRKTGIPPSNLVAWRSFTN